jgi:cystathionine beta-lyase/cystathionine gamma-synthase
MAKGGAVETRSPSLETLLIHAGERERRISGAVATPIFQSSVFEIGSGAHGEELVYPRYTNLPDQRELAAKLARLESGEAAVVTSSGMAAISSALVATLGEGGHLLAADRLYGGTHDLLARRLPALGLSCTFVDGADPSSWRAALRPSTRAIYLETITNPQMEVPELEAAASFAREHGILALVDNTFATPLGFRPPERGFDLSLHSATKYLNGHSDLVAGTVIGKAGLVERVREVLKAFGGTLDPHACFLLHRGLKTLALRVRQQWANAQALAHHLAAHPAVESVRYPGLADSPSHHRARRLLDGFGGMLAFEVSGGREAADHFLSRVRLATHAPSLGGVETLVVSPARSSHSRLTPEERAAAGIGDGLIRVSVGIEGIDDLVADFDQALQG